MTEAGVQKNAVSTLHDAVVAFTVPVLSSSLTVSLVSDLNVRAAEASSGPDLHCCTYIAQVARGKLANVTTTQFWTRFQHTITSGNKS